MLVLLTTSQGFHANVMELSFCSLRSHVSGMHFFVTHNLKAYRRETVAINEPDAFFPLLDALTDPELVPPATTKTPEALEQLVLHSAASLGYLSKPMAREIAQMQLALHSASPKLEAFYQHYISTAQEVGSSRDIKSCGSWVDWYGEVVCDGERLYELTAYETIAEDQKTAEHSCVAI